MRIVCPFCGSPAEVTENPFRGQGLAVHPYLLNCSGCDRVVLDIDPRLLRAPPPRHGVWARLGASVRRLFGG